MGISKQTEAKILRYYHVEKWRVGTIAKELAVHHTTVKKVLSKKGAAEPHEILISPLLEPFLPFVLETLKAHPDLTASRLYHMVRERGYRGGPDHFRHLVSLYRPKKTPEAYMRLKMMPGEVAQADWGHFGHVMIGKAKRPLMAFVLVLSYSRKIFLHFYLNSRMDNFLRGHQEAFAQWGGVPRIVFYDNLSSVVLERQGDAIRFNPTFLKFAAYHHFEPRPMAVARGNEKGRVERSIRFIRSSFFAARKWKDIADLNRQAQQWCDGLASERPCPEDRSRSINEVYEEEKSCLLKLPNNPYTIDERTEVRVPKTPYVRFDLNDYSVPYQHVQQTLTVTATLKTIDVIKEGKVIAHHPRSYDKGQQIETPAHIAELAKRKRQARQHRGQNQLTKAIPESADLLKKAAQQGYQLRTIVRDLLRLLEDYGVTALRKAIKATLSSEVAHINTVRVYLQKARHERLDPPPVHLQLPDDERVRDQIICPHDLKSYDRLQPSTDNKKKTKGDE